MKKVPDYILVRSRWVMANKGDSSDPDMRARLVGCEVNKGGEKVDAFFASTPPLEAKRILFSQFASERTRKKKPVCLSVVDVRKAYFNGKPTRNLYMAFPKEMGLAPNLVGKLVRCAYGCRDAGHIWELCYRGALESMGFTTGAASPCCFFHPVWNVNVVVHGDDFTAMGTAEDLDRYEQELAKHFELKIRGRIGEGLEGPNEIRILNRCLKLTSKGLVYEADPRHVDLLVGAFNLLQSPGVGTSGVKDAYFEQEAETSEDQDTSEFLHQVGVENEVVVARLSGGGSRSVREGDRPNLVRTSDAGAAPAVEAPDKKVYSSSLDVGGDKIHLYALPSSKIRFDLDENTYHEITPYSEIYGSHPSRLVSTDLGFKSVPSHSDRFTGKSVVVMNARNDRVHEKDRIAKAQARRELILRQLNDNG